MKWTKEQKRCPKHGLVLRKETEYSHKANYCPACGEKLISITVPPLFSFYFHPAIAVCLGVLMFISGFLYFADFRGCIQESRKQNAIAELKQQEERARLMATMPSGWKTLYAGMASGTFYSDRWNVLRDYFKKQPEHMLPYLEPAQIKIFLQLLESRRRDDAFALIMKHMKSGETAD